MEIVALIILILFSLTGFVAIFFTTFGTWIIFLGSIIYAVLTKFSILNVKSLILLLILYVSGEIMEYLSVIIGAKKFGASNLSVVGALVGGIIGAVAGVGFLGIGLIFGTFLGVFVGAFVVELIIKRDIIKSLKAGAGSVLGRMGSIVFKVLLAMAMFGIIIYRIIKSGGI